MIKASSIINRYLSSYVGLSRLCLQGIFLSFIEAALGGICFFLSIYFVEVLHFNIAIAGIIISFYGFGTVIGGFMGGKLSDRFNPTVVSIFSLLLEANAFLFLLKIKTSSLLMLDLFILGFASYSFLTSNNILVLHHCHEQEKLKAINLLTVASNLGLGVSALIVSKLSCYRFQYYFVLNGVLFSLFAVYLLYKERKQIKNTNLYTDQKKKIIIETENELKENENNKIILRLILICLFATGLLVAQLGTTCSIYIKESFPEFGLNSISILFAINSLLIVLFQVPIVNLFSHVNKMLIAGIGAFFIGISMLMLNFSFVFAVTILTRVVFTIGEMLFFSTAQLICYESGIDLKKGYRLGIYRTTYAASVVIGPTIGGFIYFYFSGNTLWYMSGVIGLVCLMICYKYKSILIA